MTPQPAPTGGALLFDLDGTLADTALDIAGALDATLQDLGLDPAGIDQTRLWIGGGAPALVQRALDARMTEAKSEIRRNIFGSIHKTALPLFMQHYEKHNATHCKLYPGVASTLDKLKDKRTPMACVTNKPLQFAVQVLEKFGLLEHFSTVIGGDSLAHKKPHALPLHSALRHLGRDPELSWMIGDSAADVNGARNAGTKVAWVSYGYHQGLGGSELRPDRICDQFCQVLELI